jgi:heat shock protein HspQ
MNRVAKFNIGDVVLHQRQGYRAVVIDVDPLFQASGRYNPQVSKRPFSTRNPWYRLLVDGSSQMTYVEECLLSGDDSHQTVRNPHIRSYLVKHLGGYVPRLRGH